MVPWCRGATQVVTLHIKTEAKQVEAFCHRCLVWLHSGWYNTDRGLTGQGFGVTAKECVFIPPHLETSIIAREDIQAHLCPVS